MQISGNSKINLARSEVKSPMGATAHRVTGSNVSNKTPGKGFSPMMSIKSPYFKHPDLMNSLGESTNNRNADM